MDNNTTRDKRTSEHSESLSETMKEFIEEVKAYLAGNLSSGRFKHTQGVAMTAKDMANTYGANQEKAEIAGWLHDIAKEHKPKQLLEEAKTFKIKLDPVDIQSPHLLHARVGAKIAAKQFNIDDYEILDAISQHTLGKPQMSLLEKILFIADAIEPNRKADWSEPIKTALDTHGLNAAIIKCCENTIIDLAKQKKLIHPMTINTFNFYINAPDK
ncbi:MAG: bis(5'-nucleosyl)-tetraphosphatase (symmetrical) YqeK [Candidatus Caenarcaniphilales bacterium]|nr:bis(5'-nucleosyl)-tetraphosphatase (symmetrical) YqeK [Candidatus Caenarcaniphilales bacterium]